MDPDTRPEAPVRRRRRSGLLAGVLAVGALGAFSVGAVANGGESPSEAAGGGSAPSFIQEQPYGAPGERGPGDCPERDGERSGSETQPRETTPSAPSTGDDVAL